MSQNPAKFRQYVSESSAQQNFTEGQIIQEWKKSTLFKKTKYLSPPTKALINWCSWHLWTNNKLIVKQIRWVSWPKCLVASWSALLKLIRKINWLLHNIVWNQRQIDYLFNSIYRLTTTGTLWGESFDDRRDPLTKDLWWMICMRWRHNKSNNIIKVSKDLIDTNPLTHP